MLDMFRRLRCDGHGVTSLEYAVLAVGCALALIAGAQALSGGLNAAFTAIGGRLVGLL